MSFQIGQGFDAHAFIEVPGDLILGGVSIPYHKTLEAHSDGDVLIHAVCDALLGASGLGDCGEYFPSDSPQWKDISSLRLLAEVIAKLTTAGWRVHNMDSTIIAQSPLLGPYTMQMRRSISEVIGISTEQISIKAKTTDRLGFTGRSEGIAALAVILIHSEDKANK